MTWKLIKEKFVKAILCDVDAVADPEPSDKRARGGRGARGGGGGHLDPVTRRGSGLSLV